MEVLDLDGKSHLEWYLFKIEYIRLSLLSRTARSGKHVLIRNKLARRLVGMYGDSVKQCIIVCGNPKDVYFIHFLSILMVF